jgi:predicted DNA-binding transcriptional regulator AlpA
MPAPSTLLRFNDLKARGIVRNWTTLLRWIRRGEFPPGRQLGPNTRVWDSKSIEEFLASRPAAPARRNGGERK